MTDPEPDSSPCQAPPGYWDEEKAEAQAADETKDGPKNEVSPAAGTDQSDPRERPGSACPTSSRPDSI